MAEDRLLSAMVSAEERLSCESVMAAICLLNAVVSAEECVVLAKAVRVATGTVLRLFPKEMERVFSCLPSFYPSPAC